MLNFMCKDPLTYFRFPPLVAPDVEILSSQSKGQCFPIGVCEVRKVIYGFKGSQGKRIMLSGVFLSSSFASLSLWFLFSAVAEKSLELTMWTLFCFNGQTLWLVRRLAPLKRSEYVFVQHRSGWASLIQEDEESFGFISFDYVCKLNKKCSVGFNE